ncbi:DsbA family oxidoreductase [Pseudothauera nasutitermitis]|uniref:DsbA family oxidoreductase n=1 Tax=Pseudothauera nasutitermitis TaxID=2565930 RepID=A0A4S4ASM3_9RHOO|nr:DsbA family oxidoreductase [Pseudothauera nasutitermitis]THF62847.1 DsbA family oxidoreductase [Pseudothauera nasutitermitis]
MTLTIDLVSDFVCPWCYLGKTHLDRALEDLRASHPSLPVQVNWLPFFLDAKLPAGGMPYAAYMEAKFGGPQAVEAANARLLEAAADGGPRFAFERIKVRPNTLKAHRLCYRAQRLGARPEHLKAFTDSVFAAYFEHGRDIGDNAVLAELAEAAGGARRADILEYLESDEDSAAVLRMAQGIAQQGIGAVPFFILARQLGVSGAQSPAVLGAAILQALGEGGRA